jgi:hypothetical protein
MRPQIVIALLLAGLAGFGGIILLKKLTAPAPSSAILPAQPPAAPTVPQAIKPAPQVSQIAPPVKQVVAAKPVPPVPPAAVPAAGDAAKNAADLQAHLDKLQELQANDDAASLLAILSELTNSDKTIRAAAVEATIQFGSRDAIPVLKDLAARTGEAAEKKQLLDAADFLALPTLTEIRAQNPDVKIIPPAGRP